MPLNNRILTVTFLMPSGNVTLDQSINLKVNIHKAALALQNMATIEVIGLTGSLRETLLSQFTSWNQRRVDEGLANQDWIGVEIQAGWDVPSTQTTTQTDSNPLIVFRGEVALCDITSSPPDMSIRITCFTHQIDRSKQPSEVPDRETMPYQEYVAWAAGQMGFGTNYVFNVSPEYAQRKVTNPGRNMHSLAALLVDIQDAYKPDVAAFIDDGVLIVKDRDAILNPGNVPIITSFIGVPTWNDVGVEFKTLFDPKIVLANGASLISKMNPSLNGQYVLYLIEYELTSRETPFYVKAMGSPPA